MILLSGHSRTAAKKIPLEALSLSLKERESTAAMTPADMDGITMQSWMADDTEPGKDIVWRVRSIQQQFAVDTPTVQLEHVINVLRDRIIFGEVTPADMGGGDTCTAEQAVRFILGKQSDWKLGKFDFSTTEGAWKFDGDSLYEALSRVSDSLEEPWWTFDTTKYPFTLNIIKKPSGVACELRPGRNLSAVTKTIDKTGMYTRFYPIGKDDLKLSGNGYVSKNEDVYGVICKSEVDQSLETEAALRRRANARLRKHAHPTVEVQAEGVELAAATGESIDKLTLGRLCRIPLTEFNTTIEERIVSLDYRDKLGQPESVRITLSNKSDDAKVDLARIIAEEIREGAGPSGRGRGGRGSAKQAKEDHAWFEDTDKHVAMCAVGIIGTDAQGEPNWVRLSRLDVNEDGIVGTVQSIQGDVVVAESRIHQTETSISQTVQAIGKDGKITAASICTAINRGSSEVLIDADHIRLTGSTTIAGLLSVSGGDLIVSKNICAGLGSGNYIQGGSLRLVGSSSSQGANVQTLTASDISEMIIKAAVSGNTLQLWKHGDSTAGTPSITFSRAVGTWEWGGSNGKIKVTAKPQNQSVSVDVRVAGDATITENGTYTYKAQYEDSEGSYWNFGAEKTITVDVAGGSYSGRNFNCTKKEQAYPGSTTYIYTFTLEGNYSFSAGNTYTFYRTSW